MLHSLSTGSLFNLSNATVTCSQPVCKKHLTYLDPNQDHFQGVPNRITVTVISIFFWDTLMMILT